MLLKTQNVKFSPCGEFSQIASHLCGWISSDGEKSEVLYIGLSLVLQTVFKL